MNKYSFFYWLSRGLAIIYILFLALFALDIFEIAKSPLEILTGLFMHLIPNFILTFILVIAWRWNKAGGLLFILLAGLMFYFFGNPFWVNVSLFGPLALIGLLFIANGRFLKNENQRSWAS